VRRSLGDLAIAAPQKPVLVNIIEVVTLHDGREILPFRLHLAHPAAPWGDPQISGLEWAQNDFTPVSVKPFFDLMRCHPHDPTSFLQEKILSRATLLTLRPVTAKNHIPIKAGQIVNVPKCRRDVEYKECMKTGHR
jgi:hypothetical protein